MIVDPYDAANLKARHLVEARQARVQAEQREFVNNMAAGSGDSGHRLAGQFSIARVALEEMLEDLPKLFVSTVGPGIDIDLAAEMIVDHTRPLVHAANNTGRFPPQDSLKRIYENLQLAIFEVKKEASIVTQPFANVEIDGTYMARVINVMIASPGDVPEERKIAREVVHAWNDMHSETRGIILMPKRWEEHSSPKMGDRAQAIINAQILENCALLVAIFWTRIGTPTGGSPSGTVEEIERHISSGRPTMIYFSKASVQLDKVDREQYDELIEFCEEYKGRGLVEFFDSADGFRDKFSRQLAQTINREFSGANLTTAPELVAESAGTNLSDEALKLLLAAQSGGGTICHTRTRAGLEFSSGCTSIVLASDSRTEATWVHALNLLLGRGLLESRGGSGVLFGLTKQGYDVADEYSSE